MTHRMMALSALSLAMGTFGLLAACGASPDTSQLTSETIKNFLVVDDDVVFRSGRLTEANYRELAQRGIGNVVNLEQTHDESDWAEANGIGYFSIPIGGVACPTLAEIERTLAIVDEHRDEGTLIHCFHGKDRTGIMAAAYRIRFNLWSVDRAIAELRDLGHLPALYHCDDVLYDLP